MDFVVNTVYDILVNKVNHHRNLNEYMNKLKRKCEELNSRKEDIELKMKTDLRPGKMSRKEVEHWLDNVQMINDKKQNIENEVGDTKFLKRSSVGEKVAELIQEVDELHQKGSFSNGLVVDALPRNGEIFPTPPLAGKTTVERIMEGIKACLINDDVRMIGVYGTAGSGKTTIMQHINNCILKEIDKFDGVIWVTVSKASSVIKLQNDIARVLNVDISDYEDEITRAAKLFSILRGKQRHVLIMDGISKTFCLDLVGIPEPTIANGCKILLTTQSRDVCRRMGCKGIEMKLVSKDEAWNLFLDKVGHDVLHTPTLEALAKLVAEECACLPLAIITIATNMRGAVEEFEWRNALEQLRESKREFDDVKEVLEHWISHQ